LNCGDENSTANICQTDNCNCPNGFTAATPNNNNNIVAAPNNGTTYDSVFGDMKKIMYPIMGVIFGILWVVLAFIGTGLKKVFTILLYIVGFIDAIFGIFLIFIPVTTFLGLFYMAVGAFTLAITRHRWGGDRGIDFLLALSFILFLLTGGLTFVAYDWGYGSNYVADRMSGYVPWCDNDMNIYDDNNGIGRGPGYRSMRCGNYAYFVTFCVFLLFLVQPIAMIAAAFRRVGHHQDTTVTVTETKQKSENKNTV